MVSARVDLRVETGHGRGSETRRRLQSEGSNSGGRKIEGHVDTDLIVSDNSRDCLHT